MCLRAAICMLLLLANGALSKKRPNVIFLIGDGFGPASQTFARYVYQSEHQKDPDYKLPLDYILRGTVRTRSSDSLITDSGAGATAYASGKKSYNGAVGVDAEGHPIGTLLEAAQAAGMATGLVVTNKITDATPASFSAHQEFRTMENEIAAQQIGGSSGQFIDLLLGGGLCHFAPASSSTVASSRTDDLDLLKIASSRGYRVITDRSEFDRWNPRESSGDARVLGLLARKHLAYEIDRDPSQEPSISEMTERALEFMGKNPKAQKEGFFLMIEGSRIDVAAHSNDPAAHYREIVALNKATKAALRFAKKNSDTLVIATADHETGGLTLGLQAANERYPEYLWEPKIIHTIKHSSQFLSRLLQRRRRLTKSFLVNVFFPNQLGVSDATEEEVQSILRAKSALHKELVLNRIVNHRARLGWTTHGHTGVDVNLYAFGHRSDEFAGAFENTQIFEKLQRILDVDVDAVTKRLRAENKT